MKLLFFSMGNAFRKKAVIPALLGVAIGTALMTVLFSLSVGMEKRAENTFSSLADQITVSGRDAIFGGLFWGMGTTPIPATYISAIKNLPHVVRVQSQVSVIMRPRDINYAMPLFGYDPLQVAGIKDNPFNNIKSGRAPAGAHEVIMGRSLQEYLSLINCPVGVGDRLAFLIPRGGRMTELDLKITGIYQTGNEVLDSAFSASESLARYIGGIPANDVSAITVNVDDVHDVEATAAAIQNALAGKVPQVQAVIPRQVLNPVKKLLDLFGKFLVLVSLVAVAAGGLSILVVMLLSVVHRMREFGILKALGWTPGDIVFMVLVESLVLSMSGALLGVGIGWAGLQLARVYIAGDVALLTWPVAASVCLVGMAIGALGGFYPAWRAGRVSPAAILRNN